MRKIYILFILIILFLFVRCTKNESVESNPFILLKTGDAYTANEARVPVGGQLKFGLSAVGDGFAITNLTIKRVTASNTIIELDKGLYLKEGGLDTIVIFTKGSSETETWLFSILNENRDTASVSVKIYLGEGSAYGDINYFPNITIAYQNNTEFPHYLDLHSGTTYNETTITGNESNIDLVSYYYLSSGTSSPTLSCPGYNSAAGYYPELTNWTTKNSTLYDYSTTDNDLISIAQFDASQNDSLMVTAYIPNSTSGTCKFCYTGKVIPFKANNGKYGLIKVIRADETDTGSIEISIKIQQ